MSSTNPIEPDAASEVAPPRPSTPPIRLGFVWVFILLCILTGAVYGVPFFLEQVGYAYEKGRARASIEVLKGADREGLIARSSELFRLATQAISPAVVHIQTQSYQKEGGGLRGLGSGVVIDKAAGLIVTNQHVIKDADVVTVRVGRQTELVAKIVGADPQTDLAVIRVEGNLPAEATWGDSDKLEQGDWVLAVGSPLGLDRTVSAGIVSATTRHELGLVGQDAYEDFLQTDVAINPGNSGGPLVDLRGQVVGINTAISLVSPESGGGNQGIGFAISSSLARRVVKQLVGSGKVVRGYLGVSAQPMSTDQARSLKVPDERGALVNLVLPNSPASKGGLLAGDVVVGIDGKPVSDPATLRNLAFTLEVGRPARVAIVRGGEPRTLVVNVEEMKTPSVAFLGFDVKEVAGNPDLGVLEVTEVVSPSSASSAGLKVGDRVLGIGRRRLFSKAELQVTSAQAAGEKSIPLSIAREGRLEVLLLNGPAPE